MARQDLYGALVELGMFPPSLGPKLNVLVVDDDPAAVELVAVSILGLAGKVRRAYGGRDAISIVRQELPDLVVLDLWMPEVDGFDVVKALQEHPDTARIPILVVTAKHITAEDCVRLDASGTPIIEKAGLDCKRFTAEVRRAMAGRAVA